MGYNLRILSRIFRLCKENENKCGGGENSGIINILHISDIHNNPAAFDFIRRITDIYNIDLIIDTGDRVDYGTVLEMEFLAHSMDGIDVPCVFIPGNHDSPLVVEKLKMSENVSVLEEGIMETAGLRIAGLADSSSRVAAMTVESEDMIEDNARKLAKRFPLLISRSNCYNPAYLKYVRNNDHLLLSGHLHTPYVKDEAIILKLMPELPDLRV